jgi:hypothetical protein
VANSTAILFKGLSEDDRQASFELLTRVEEYFLEGRPNEVAFCQACGVLEAFYDAHGWTVPDPLRTQGGVSIGSDQSFDDAVERARGLWRRQFESFRNQILGNKKAFTKAVASGEIRRNIDESAGYAVLSNEEKEAVHSHLDKIRVIISDSQLGDRKKNRLSGLVNDLAAEVDRIGTRTDAFFSLMGEVGLHLGEFGENSRPLWNEVRETMKIVLRSRARKEDISLPPGEEVLSLPIPEENP